MGNKERIGLWSLIVVLVMVVAYVFIRFDGENKDLRLAVYRLQGNQDQLNNNLKGFAQATEQQLTQQSVTINGISQRVGPFRAARDSDSGAVIWD